LSKALSKIARDHKGVIFEGNGYSEEWHAEAARRGLPNNRTTVDALPALLSKSARQVFAKFGVLTERELESRSEIFWERYVKVGNIEANCAVDIARTMILPAAVRYLGELGVAGTSRGVTTVADRVSGLVDGLVDAIAALEAAQHKAHEAGDVQREARVVVDTVIPAQAALRAVADDLETVVNDDLWPLPKYRELLFQY
jgi:glutamine synthetase